MAGLLDDMFGRGDQDAKDEYGQTRRERAQPGWDGLIKAGLLAVAGGGNIMPNERARYIGGIGEALGNTGTEASNLRSQSAQNVLRAQQVQATKQELAQKGQWQQLANSPQFREAMSKLTPAEQALAAGAAMKGDFGTVEKLIDPKKNRPDVKADGTIVFADGSVQNSLGVPLAGPGGTPLNAGQPGAPAGKTDPLLKMDEVLGPSKVEGRDDAFLKQVAEQYGPRIAKQVRDIADYKVPLPISARTSAITNPNSATAQIVQLVTSYAPDWQQGDFANQNKLWNEFYGTGKTAKNITALDTAYGHLGTFYDAAQALKGGDTPAARAAINYVREKLGKPEVTNARMAMLAVGHELAKVFRDSGMSVGEIDSWEKQLSPNMSDAQIQGSIEMAQKLMEGRVDSLQTQYSRGSKGTKPGQWFTPSHVEKNQHIKDNPLGGKKQEETTPTPGAGGAPTSYTAPNGTVVSIDEINATARSRKKTPQQVIEDLQLKPGGN